MIYLILLSKITKKIDAQKTYIFVKSKVLQFCVEAKKKSFKIK